MGSLDFRFAIGRANGQQAIRLVGIVLGVFLLGFTFPPNRVRAQTDAGGAGEFKRLARELSTNRVNGAAESEAQQRKALAYLDTVAISLLNGSGSPDLDIANQRLAGLTSLTPPVGENYRLQKLDGTPSAYALVVNFGLDGPAAIRIYAGAPGPYVLAGSVDQFSQKGFLDSDIELVPIWAAGPVFVTVAGRTDDLSTGLFSAWRFDGHAVVALWSSDLLQQSDYEADGNGFHLTYCGHPDDDRPEQCLQMTRDLYRFQDGQWKRVETVDLPPVNAPGK